MILTTRPSPYQAGTITDRPGPARYMVADQAGRTTEVTSDNSYNIGDRVLHRDGVILARAARPVAVKTYEV